MAIFIIFAQAKLVMAIVKAVKAIRILIFSSKFSFIVAEVIIKIGKANGIAIIAIIEVNPPNIDKLPHNANKKFNDKLFKIKQNERELEKELHANLIQTVGDIGNLPNVGRRIRQGHIGSNENEREFENKQEQLKHNIMILKQRGPLLPITGKRQTQQGEFYSTISKTNPNTKRLRTEGGKRKTSKQRKSRRTMKKRN